MAGEGEMSTLSELILQGAALAAVKEEVNELRLTLTAVRGELAAVKGKLEAVECELAGVKGELAEKLAEGSKALDAQGLRGESRKRKQETTADSAPEEERARDVQELNEPRNMEASAACEEGQMTQDLKLDVALQIRQSKGHRKLAWQNIKSASQRPTLNLKG
ncbi:unnamed protein product [Closterium sp. NIES-65]|nr:unnamed protein product [Closterium sp. NIES-65]